MDKLQLIFFPAASLAILCAGVFIAEVFEFIKNFF